MKDRKNSSLLRRLEKFQRLFFVALLSVLAVGAFAQSKTVSGTVLDKTGESVMINFGGTARFSKADRY